VFEAFPLLARVAPQTDWESLAMNGRRFVAEAKFGEAELPTDWIALGAEAPEPAVRFPAEFGYNSLRIPLYLMRAGQTEPALLRHFQQHFAASGGATTFSVFSNEPVDALDEPGYRIIGAALDCVLDGTRVPPDLLQFQAQSYYGSTLHLLTLSFLRESAPECL
jgi:endoglucanase